jgi:hypothetical protein
MPTARKRAVGEKAFDKYRKRDFLGHNYKLEYGDCENYNVIVNQNFRKLLLIKLHGVGYFSFSVQKSRHAKEYLHAYVKPPRQNKVIVLHQVAHDYKYRRNKPCKTY